MKIWTLFPALITVLFALACHTKSNEDVLIIKKQPETQTKNIGDDVVFDVSTNKTNNVNYKWYFNDILMQESSINTFAIKNAIGSDNDSSIFVVAMHDDISINSDIAKINLNNAPTNPNKNDYRFKNISKYPVVPTWSEQTNIIGIETCRFQNQFGIPIALGGHGGDVKYNYTWFVYSIKYPGINIDVDTIYKSFDISEIDVATNIENSIILSMDANIGTSLCAIQYITSPNLKQYKINKNYVKFANIQDYVKFEGNNGKIITSSCVLNDFLFCISYSFDDIALGVFKNVVEIADKNNILEKIKSMSSNGYMITSICGNYIDGYYVFGSLIGISSFPRDVIDYNANNVVKIERNYACIARIMLPVDDANRNFVEHWIFQR